MAGSNNFKQFDSSKANMLNDADYNANPAITNGVSSGQASSLLHNKLFYQLSTFIAALGNSLAGKGYVVSDNDLDALKAIFDNIWTKADTITKANFADAAGTAGTANSANNANKLNGKVDTDFATAAQGGKADAALPATGQAADSAKLGGNLANLFVKTTDFINSLDTNGYEKFPNGLVMQWGTSAQLNGHTTLDINFPIAFPNNCFNIQITATAADATPQVHDYVTNVTVNGFILHNTSAFPSTYYWFAIGK